MTNGTRWKRKRVMVREGGMTVDEELKREQIDVELYL